MGMEMETIARSQVTSAFNVPHNIHLIHYLHRAADIFDISSATNIANTDYDLPSGSIAPGGQLVVGITSATYTPFVQYINSTQLARFGLHNGKPVDQTLINSKWESLALAPVGDHEYPNDYFLFTFVSLLCLLECAI
jgi:hypothetical protein